MRARRAGDRRRRLRRARRRPRRARRRAARCGARSPRARRSCASPATSCSAGRRRGWWSGAPTRSPRARAHPLARALRLDKLGLAALEATLRLYRDPERARREIPVLAMLSAGEAELRRARGAARGADPRAPRSSPRPRGSAAARCRCSSCRGRWSPSAGGGGRRAGGAAAGGRPAGDRPHRGRAAAAGPAHAARATRRRPRGARSPRRARNVPDTFLAPLTLGTAGHIDHGKTALIRALTGVDTDRLPEERERGISIELGYAPLDAARRAAAVGGRRARPRAVRAHDGRGRDGDRPVPDGRRRRRRRDAADARARRGAGGARRDRGRRRGDQGRRRRP